MKKFSSNAMALASLLVCAQSGTLLAGTTWDGGGNATNTITTPANWDGDAVPTFTGFASTLTFGPGGTATSASINTNVEALGIGFTRTADQFSLVQGGSSTLTVGSGGINTNGGTRNFLINMGLTMATDQVWDVAATAPLRFTGGAITDGASTFGITKTGAGTLQLYGTTANTYDGVTNLNLGSIGVQGNSTLGSSVGNTVMQAGTTLTFINAGAGVGDQMTVNEEIVMQGSTGSTISYQGSGSFLASALTTQAGNISLDGTGAATFSISSSPTSVKFTGNIARTGSNSGVINIVTLNDLITGINGNRTMTFDTAVDNNGGAVNISGRSTAGEFYTYTVLFNATGNDIGAVTLNSDQPDRRNILQIGVNDALATTQNLTITRGIFDLNGKNQTINMLSGVSGSGTTGPTALVTNSAVGTASVFTLGSGDGTGVDMAGVIENGLGTVRLVKTGTGIQSLSGVNTYTGTTVIEGGTLRIGSGGTTGAISTQSLITANGTLGFNRSNTLVQGADFSGLIIGSGGVAQSGTGTTILTNANTYSGLTSVNTGALLIQNSQALGTTAGGTTVASGAALQLEGGIQVGAEALTLNGTGSLTTGALRNISGNNSYGGQLTLAAASRINSDAGTLTLNSPSAISGATFGLTVGGAGDTSIQSAIATTSGTVAKDGSGTLVMAGNNTYTGTTTLNAGTLSLDYGSQDNSKLSNTAALILGGGNLVLTGGTHVETVASTTLQAGGSTTISRVGGSSVLNLNAFTSNNGTTVQFASGGIATTDTTNTSGILGGQYTVGTTDWAQNSTNGFDGSITAYTGYTFNNDPSTWTGTTLNISNNGTLSSSPLTGTQTIRSLRFDAAGTASVNGTLTLGSGGLLVTSNVAAPSAMNQSGGTGNLTSSGSNLYVIQNSASDFTIGANITGSNALVKSGAGKLILSNAANGFTGQTYINGGTLQIASNAGLGAQATGAALNLNGGTLQITSNVGLYNVNPGTNNRNVNLGGNGGVFDTNGNTLTVAGVLANLTSGVPGGLTKAGAGSMILAGANTYTGPTIINEGTLQVGNNGTSGSLSASSPITTNGTLAFHRTNPITQGTDFSNVISGTGGVTQLGSGSLILTAANTFTGPTIVNAGTLQIGNAGATGSLSPSSAITTNGTLVFNRTNTVTQGVDFGTIGGTGGVTHSQALGTLILNAPNTYAGNTSVGAGVVNIQNATALGTTAGGTTVANGAVLQIQGGISVGAETLTLNGTGISSTGAFRSISGLNTFGGLITLASAGRIATDSGTLTLTNPGTIGGAFNLTVGGSGNTVIQSVIGTGSGTFTKDNTGTVTLSGANSYAGTTTINAGGALNIQNATALGTTAAGTTVVSGGALQMQGGISVGSEALGLSGTGVSATGALRNISGDNTFGGPITLAAASRINSDAGTLTLNSGSAISGATFALTFGGSGNTTVSSVIGTTTGTVTKDGLGTLTLAGANTYTGLTRINAGGLTLDYSTSNTSKLSDSTALQLGGGTLTLSGGSHTEVVASTAVQTASETTITRSGGTSVLNLNALSGDFGTVRFASSGIATTDTTNTNGILRTQFIVGTTDWAQNSTNGTDGAITAYTGYTFNNTPSTWTGSTLNISNNATLTGAAIGTQTINSLRLDAGGTATVNGTLTLASGGLLVTSNVTSASAISGSGNLTTSNNYLYIDQNSASDLTIGARVGGFYLLKSGTGRLILTNPNNNYAGATYINGGILQISSNGNLANQSTGAILHLNGGTLELAADVGLYNGTPGTNARQVHLGGNGGTFDTNGYALTISGLVRDLNTDVPGTFTKTGAGTLNLSGTNTYTGLTNIASGVVNIQSNLALGSATSGTTVSAGAALQMQGGLVVEAEGLTLAGTGVSNDGALRSLSGINTYRGQVTLGSSARINTDAGTLSIDSLSSITGSGNNLTVGGAGNTVVKSLIETGSGSLSKDGSGTLTLTAANAYTGSTTINAGTLLVSSGNINTTSGVSVTGSSSRLTYNSATGLNRNVTVSSGAALGYNSSANYTGSLTFTNGTLEGTNWNGNLSALTIDSGRTISPGNSPGTATTGSQTWGESGTYVWEINNVTGTGGFDPGWDLLAVSGALNLSASSANPFAISIVSLTLLNVAGEAANFSDLTSYAWKIAEAGSAISGFSTDIFSLNTSGFVNTFTGTFGIALGNSPGIGGTDAEIYLTYTAVPEPATWALLAVALTFVVVLRRRRMV